jgi:iron complex transport system substrate-binding protein
MNKASIKQNKMNKKLIWWFALVAAAAGGLFYFLAAGTPKPAIEKINSGKQITDLSGKTRTFKTPCERVVMSESRSIYEFSTVLENETPGAIKAWGDDLITADADAYKKYLEAYPSIAQIPLIGSVYNEALDTENVLSYNPDLVVVDNFMTRRGLKCVANLENAGLPLAFFDQTNDILVNQQKGITVLGQLFDKEERAKEITDFVDEQINIVTSRLAKIDKEKAPLVYMETGNKGPSEFGNTWGVDTNGKYTAWSAMIQDAGGNNIVDNRPGQMLVLDPEYVLKSDPDIIIFTGANWTSAKDSLRMGYYAPEEETRRLLKNFTNRPGWQNLKAVKNNRVYAVHHGFVMHIFYFASLQQMAKWFYPEEFADVDPIANLKEFHRRFMPFEYSGTWITGLDKQYGE